MVNSPTPLKQQGEVAWDMRILSEKTEPPIRTEYMGFYMTLSLVLRVRTTYGLLKRLRNLCPVHARTPQEVHRHHPNLPDERIGPQVFVLFE